MNRSVIVVVIGCGLLAGAAWMLAARLSGGWEDYQARYASSPVVKESASEQPRQSTPDNTQAATPSSLQGPPPRHAVPDGKFGDLVRQGERIFNDTRKHAGAYVNNDLNCRNCHFDAGRYEKTASLRSAWPMYPAYRGKNQHVNDYAERLQGCFVYSMNGKTPPRDGEVIQALQAYSFWLAKGMPTGEPPKQRGFPKIEKPSEPPSYARGEAVFQKNCALCHGEDGQGQKAADGTMGFPPLWGAGSYNWGAGMHRINTAAAFIKAAMPLGKPELTDQQAWDVALFINSHERPQDPRFDGSVEETAHRFHQHQCQYGKKQGNHVLGEQAAGS